MNANVYTHATQHQAFHGYKILLRVKYLLKLSRTCAPDWFIRNLLDPMEFSGKDPPAMRGS
jgi:hypothetical protein